MPTAAVGRRTSAGEADSAAPIVVLTYPHAGAELLTSVLSASPSVACTSTTGLLPACHDAISAWQQAEERTGPPSPLAIKSVRALASTMITVIQARGGARTWCEITYSSPEVAESFLHVFPAARFLCLYRSMRGVLSEAVRAYPWGLGGTPFWAYSAGHPGNNAATIAAYWAGRTEALLEFESSHPDSCVRIRNEDLLTDPGGQGTAIFTSLGLNDSQLAVPREPPAMGGPWPGGATAGAAEPALPTDRIPPALLARAGELHARLGYKL